MPNGVFIPKAQASAIIWVTFINSTLMFLNFIISLLLTTFNLQSSIILCSINLFLTNPIVRFIPYIGIF